MTPTYRYNKLLLRYLSVVFLGFLTATNAFAQSKLMKDSSYILRIPNIITMVNSPTHFYVLSSSDGLVVFRAHPDTLDWLYTSPGMQKRGDKMTADIRFAYLFGNGNRLTVIEPTSLLGVYSSTNLPAPALDVHRMNNSLYLAMGKLGIGKISLITPDAVDSAISFIRPGPSIIDLKGTDVQLLALGDNQTIYEYNANGDTLSFQKSVKVNKNLNHIFLLKNELLGSTNDGQVYSISNNGKTTHYFTLPSPVIQIAKWKDFYLMRDSDKHLWVAKQGQKPFEFRKEPDSGNLFTINQHTLWVSQFNQISKMYLSATGTSVTNEKKIGNAESQNMTLKLEPIGNQIIPYPHPLLLAINTVGNYPAGHLKLHYKSQVKSAEIKGEGFYWQPDNNDIGMHKFTIYATSDDGQVDSTSFSVDVRSFNEPPRFSPIQPMSVPVNHKFTLQFHAIDPDGMNRNLVRYLGVNLPDGATIDEKTGEFTWTPIPRQIGKNTFRIIATDQYGAATSIPVNLTVLDVNQ